MAFSSGELYTIVTNRLAKGRKSSIVAMIKGTQFEFLKEILFKIPKRLRQRVQEVTIDISGSLNNSVKARFTNAHKVIDCFRVQHLAFDAVREIRIEHRWEALEQENLEYE